MKDARGDVALRRQGAEPAQPRPELLAEAGGRRRGPPDPERHRPGRRRRVHADRLGLRGAPPRGQPDQALPAALQRPAQGRQELPVHQDHPGRRLPADRADPQAAGRRQPLLRAVRLGDERRRVDEPDPAAVPVPDLHDRHPGGQAGPPAAVPAVPHQALPGPVHRGDLEGRLPRRHRAGRAVPRGPPGDARQGARRRDGRRRRADRVRAGGGPARQDPGHRADDGEPEDGRLRPDRARPRRPRPAGQPGGRPAVRRPRRQARSAATSSCSTPPATRPTTRSSRGFLEQYYARATSIPPQVLVPACPARTTRRPRGVPRRPARRPGPPARPAARREARAAWRSPPATRPRRSPASRPAGWPTRARRSAPCEELADALGLADPPTADRVLRHQQLPGRPVGRAAWSSSRTASRGPASTAASGSRRSRAPNDFASHQEVLRRRFRRAKAGEEGSEEELRWRLPDLVIVDGGKGQVSAAAEVLDELGLARPAAGRPGQGARGAVPARPLRADPPAADVAGALPRPAPARRGPPLRDHLPPRPAGEGVGPVRLRRPARGRSEAARGRCCACSARPSGSARRRSSRSPRCPGSARPWPADQGRPRRPDRPRRPVRARSTGISPPRCVDSFPSSSSSSASSRSSSTSGRGSSCPTLGDPNGRPARSSRRSSASTSRAASGSSTRPCRSTASRPTPAAMSTIRDIIERRVNSTGVVRAGRRRPRAATGSSSSCRARRTARRSSASSARPASSTFVPLPPDTYGTPAHDRRPDRASSTASRCPTIRASCRCSAATS